MFKYIFGRVYALPLAACAVVAGAYTALLNSPEQFIFPIGVAALVVCCSAVAAKYLRLGLGLVLYVLFCCLTYLAALFYFDARIEAVVDAQLPSELESKDLLIQGKVYANSGSDQHFQRFSFDVQTLRLIDGKPIGELSKNNPTYFKGRVRLSWKTEQRVRSGEQLSLVVRLKTPRGFVNPKAFDYQHWLLSQGILATGYVKRAEPVEVKSSSALALSQQHFVSSRQSLIKSLKQATQQLSNGAIILALLTGDKSGIRQSDWALFQRTGTIHLMAISGLHVAMVSTFAAFVFSLISKPLCLFIRPFSLRAMSFAVCAFSAFGYAYMAGFSVPTQRAFYCVVILGAVWLLGRRSSYLHMLLWVAILVSFVNPLALISPGFVLSFAAVFALIFALGQRCGRVCKLILFAKAQLVVMLFLMPFLFLLGLPFSPTSPAANALAVPLVSLFILPLLLLGMILLPISSVAAETLFGVANWFLSYMFDWLDLVASQPVFASTLEPALVFVLFAAVFVFILPVGLKLRPYSLLLLGLVAVRVFSTPDVKPTTLTVLDVGQGLSVVLDNNQSLLIYDIGAKFSDSFSVANRVLLPFVQQGGKRSQIELLISHADNDHAGDIAAFVKAVGPYSKKPLVIVSGEPAELGVEGARQCLANMDLMSMAGVKSKLLWPQAGFTNLSNRVINNKTNNLSCVVLLEIRGVQVLLMGDVERDIEHYLLSHELLPQNIDVLLAPHHGSKSSSTKALVNWLRPKHVIVSAGYKNRYHHPAKEVVTRYQASGARVWNTAEHGAIRLSFEQRSVRITAERCLNPRRWYQQHSFCMTQSSSQGEVIMYH